MSTLIESFADQGEAASYFDSLPAVQCEEMLGRWKGREVRTGHPLDGMLEASGWWGKQFDGLDEVHPLLFSAPGGGLFAVDPRKVPLALASRIPVSAVRRARGGLGVIKPAIRTSKHRARLRSVEHRGVVTAAMVYDHLPIIDFFRRIDDDNVLGAMDLRGSTPYFFALARD